MSDFDLNSLVFAARAVIEAYANLDPDGSQMSKAITNLRVATPTEAEYSLEPTNIFDVLYPKQP